MRIRGSSISSSISSSSSSSHCSSFSSVSPSTISFASSANSLTSYSSNSSYSSSIDYLTRCEGLDLLVEAVLHVAGSVLGVPFTQRRVIRRRKRSFKFSKFFLTQEEEEEEEKKDEGIKVISKSKRRKRDMAFPINKYHDSVLQPWRRQSRRTTMIDRDRRMISMGISDLGES